MIALLIDADNFSSPAWVSEAVDTLQRNGGPIAVRRAYGSSENIRGLAEVLRSLAIRPFVNLSLPKNTTDVSLAVDAMELACQTPSPHLIAIASGDMDFVPLVVRLRERGIKVLCVTERSKMAQDAIPAYDQIIYVGVDQSTSPASLPSEAKPTAIETTSPKSANKPTPKKAATATAKPKVAPTAKPKAIPAKKAAEPSPAKKVKPDPTYQSILKAFPNWREGEWMHLSAAAQELRKKGLLAKSAASTKLFKKFPAHFELRPEKKPNEVRFVKA